MRFRNSVFGGLLLCSFFAGWPSAQAGLVTAGGMTVASGSSGTLNVVWSSTQSLNFLNTQFVLRSVTGASGGAVFTVNGSGDPPFPPLTDSNYVFFNDSFDFINAPSVNPASVTTTTWAGDSYIFADSTNSGLNAIQNGSRLWTTLEITGVTPGTYQLHLLSSEYDYSETAGTPVALTDADLTGGLITVIASAVPEIDPAGLCSVAAILVGALGLVVGRRRGARRHGAPSTVDGLVVDD